MPRKHWGHPEGQRPDQKPGWHLRYGDWVQEVVVIGQSMSKNGIRERCDARLLEARLALADSSAWANLPNPSLNSRWAKGKHVEIAALKRTRSKEHQCLHLNTRTTRSFLETSQAGTTVLT